MLGVGSRHRLGPTSARARRSASGPRSSLALLGTPCPLGPPDVPLTAPLAARSLHCLHGRAAGSPGERIASSARRGGLSSSHGHLVRRARPARSWVAGPPPPRARSERPSQPASGGT